MNLRIFSIKKMIYIELDYYFKSLIYSEILIIILTFIHPNNKFEFMKEFKVITKKGCSKCQKLKDWFKSNNISFDELKIEDQSVVSKLTKDEFFKKNFCDKDGCIVLTPIIYFPEENKYYFKEIFGINGLRENYLNKLLEL